MSDGKRIIRARYLDKSINIDSMFKVKPDASNLFHGEHWAGKENAQLSILYQALSEENIALKRRLGMLVQVLSQGSNSVEKVEALVRDLWRLNDQILEMQKIICTLEEKIRDLQGLNTNDKEMGR